MLVETLVVLGVGVSGSERGRGASEGGGRTRRGVGAVVGGGVGGFPFLDRFEIVRQLRGGAEADVWVCRVPDSGESCVVKVYHFGVEADAETLAAVTRGPGSVERLHPAVVDTWESGQIDDGRWYEVAEFCEDGSLDELRADGFCDVDVEGLVRQVAGGLRFLHGRDVVLRDVKPENVFVRSLMPLDLVVGDFGVGRVQERGLSYRTGGAGTLAYTPPEAIIDSKKVKVSKSWDMWSFGMMIAEVAGGRHPFELPDRELMNDFVIKEHLVTQSVDLELVADQRVQLLCRGLLTRDRKNRWGWEQVFDWLEGGSPALVQDNYQAMPQMGGTVPVVNFNGNGYSDPVQLAEALEQQWDEGVRAIFAERDRKLCGDLAHLTGYYENTAAREALDAQPRPDATFAAYLTLLTALNPDLTPTFQGHALDPSGLAEIARNVVESKSDNADLLLLDRIRDERILPAFANLRGCEHYASLNDAWQGARMPDQLTALRGRVRGEINSFENRASSESLLRGLQDPSIRSRTEAAVLLSLLDPLFHPTLHLDLRKVIASGQDVADWWVDLASSSSIKDLAMAGATHAIARQHALAAKADTQAKHELAVAAEKRLRDQAQAARVRKRDEAEAARVRKRNDQIALAAKLIGALVALTLGIIALQFLWENRGAIFEFIFATVMIGFIMVAICTAASQ